MRKGKRKGWILVISGCLLAGGCAGLPESGRQKEQSAQKEEKEVFQEPFEVYAGPSEDYFHCGTARTEEIVRILSVENDFAEVEYAGGFGYVPLIAVRDLQDGSAALILCGQEDALSEGTGPLIRFLDQVSVQPLAQSALFADADLKNRLFEIGPSDAVTILAPVSPEYGQEIFRAEMEKDGSRYRGYVNLQQLLDLNNPATGFSAASEKNGLIYYQGGVYCSTSGSLKQEGWKAGTAQQFSLSDFDWNPEAALRLADCAFSYSQDSADEKTTALMNALRIQKPFCGVVEGEGEPARQAALLLKSLKPKLAAFAGGPVTIESGLQMLDDLNGRMVMLAGEPLEKPYAGQTVSLAELLKEQASGQNPEELADALIHQMMEDIPASAFCSMELTFSDDLEENPFGWSLFFDQKMDLYAVPILHHGTSFLIYQDGHPIHDAAGDLAGCAIRLSDSIRNELQSQMEEKGYQDAAQMNLNGSAPSGQAEQQWLAEQNELLQAYAGEWVIDGPKTMEVNQKDMMDLFGSSFRYGSQMMINAGGVFSFGMGVGYGGRGSIQAENGALHYSITRDLDNSEETGTLQAVTEDGTEYLLMDFGQGDTLYWRRK